MKATQVSKENGVVKFKIEFSQDEWNSAINKAYLDNRSKFSVDGFRKGRAPRKIIENFYGRDIFWDEALNNLLQDGYYDAITEMGLEVISQPSLDSPEIKKGEPVVISGSVQVFPELESVNYKGLEVEKAETVIGEEEVQSELEKVRKSQARMEAVEGRKAEEGDTVILDYEGSIDGEVFQGGTGENYELKLGSGTFIPGFEDQLIGTDAGEDVDVKVTFPEEYHAEELAGKEALFKCKIHEIKREILPEIDDELASDVSEFETLDEYKEDLKNKLQKAADETNDSVMKDRALQALYKANEIEVPDVMIRNEVDNILYEMNQSLAGQGLSLQQYLEWIGRTMEEMRAEARTDAEKRVRTRILLKNIIRLEGITAGEEEVEKLMKEFGEQYGMTVDQVREMTGSDTEGYFREDAETKKAIELIFDSAELVEKKEEEQSEEE
jgi:trigger factor